MRFALIWIEGLPIEPFDQTRLSRPTPSDDQQFQFTQCGALVAPRREVIVENLARRVTFRNNLWRQSKFWAMRNVKLFKISEISDFHWQINERITLFTVVVSKVEPRERLELPN